MDYKALEAERLHQGEFVVIFPKGERLTAKMCDGLSSYATSSGSPGPTEMFRAIFSLGTGRT